MKMSADGRALVEAFEGCDKPVPGHPGTFTTYHDEVGVLTIGYGHTNLGNVPPHITEGDVWSSAQCDAALDNDMASFEASVEKIMDGTALTQGEYDALVSFDFNTGDLAKSSIPAKIKAGNKAGATATLLQYNHAGGKVLNGLTRRRNAEKLLFEGDVAGALKLAGAHVESTDKNPKAVSTQEHIEMSTTTPTPASDPIPGLIHFIDSFSSLFLGLAQVLPAQYRPIAQAAPVVAEEVLQGIEDVKNLSGGNLVQSLLTRIENVVLHGKAITVAVSGAAPVAPSAVAVAASKSEGMPNS